MQRKTNLFYTTGQDSNFLTFSNFTEALTGNFLATDWKVYPARFMCINMPLLIENSPEDLEFRAAAELEGSTKEYFIKKYLVGYYENKLAFLRDYYVSQINSGEPITYDIEGDIHSLSWLIETFNKFINEVKSYNIQEDLSFNITFIGDVTEFDYKGSYTDTICIIDASDGYYDENHDKLKKYIASPLSEEFESSDDYIPYKYNDNNLSVNNLYGWEEDELSSTIYNSDSVNLIFDNNENITEGNVYSKNQLYSFSESFDSSTILKFNLIIPLFDIMDLNYKTNFDVLEENSIVDILNSSETYISTFDNKEKKSINNPLGIWFSDKLIELEKDIDSQYAPSWSIIISGQFKPLPYSSKYNNEDITLKDNQQAFATYAQILSKQKTLISKIYELTSKINSLETLLNSNTSELLNNDEIQEIIAEKVNEKVTEKLNDIDSIINNSINDHINQYHKWKN